MSELVLFQMWQPIRQSFIDRHLFYVEQASKRLLSQFEDMEKETDQAAEEWLEQSGRYFDPDSDDASDFYERANDFGIEFYCLLSDMRNQTYLSVVAGMFHQWDKQLRDWLIHEINHWHRGEKITSKIWAVDFSQIMDLLDSLGWKIRTEAYFARLDACRLVVNVYKHGKGKSFGELKTNYSEYIDDTLSGSFGSNYLDHTDLKVNEAQFQAFSDAIVSFWQGVPEKVVESQLTEVPDWFAKAVNKDQQVSQQASKK